MCIDAVVFSSDLSVHMAPKIVNGRLFYDEKLLELYITEITHRYHEGG